MTISYDMTISDVVRATSLHYEFIRRALHDGSLDGLIRPLRTNQPAVDEWLNTLKSKPATVTSTPKIQTKPRPYRKSGKATDLLFRHVDPKTFGKKGG